MSWYIKDALWFRKYCSNECNRCCDYRYVLWIMTESDAINRLNNSKLDSKGTL